MIRRELSLNEGVGVEKLETENSNVAVTAYEQAIFDEDRITDDKHTSVSYTHLTLPTNREV